MAGFFYVRPAACSSFLSFPRARGVFFFVFPGAFHSFQLVPFMPENHVYNARRAVNTHAELFIARTLPGVLDVDG